MSVELASSITESIDINPSPLKPNPRRRRHIIGVVLALVLVIGAVIVILVLGDDDPSEPSEARNGQITCWDDESQITCPSTGDNFYGQDAQFEDDQDLTDNGDGTVTDNNTGLMWAQSTDLTGDGSISAADKLSQSDALAAAAASTLGGYSDWRLPSVTEMYTLMDFSGTDISISMMDTEAPDNAVPFIDTYYFDFAYGDTSASERLIDVQMVTTTFYTSSTYMEGGSTMFGVNMADGRIKGYRTTMAGADKTFNVRFVRGDRWDVNQFVDNSDSTVTDGLTGLMWEQADSGAGMNWEDALEWAQTKNSQQHLGYNDWRVPSARELQTIVDYTRSPAANGTAAIDPIFTCSGITNEAGDADFPWYWTSTTHKSADGETEGGGWACYVAFGRALGYDSVTSEWQDFHGAGAQRSDPKDGSPDAYPTGHGPQGDAIRILNYVRLVRDA